MKTETEFFKDVREAFEKIVDDHGSESSILIIATSKIEGVNSAKSAIMVDGDRVLVAAGLMESMNVPELKAAYRAAQIGALQERIDTIRKTQQN